jgi:hypothetical protein
MINKRLPNGSMFHQIAVIELSAAVGEASGDASGVAR